MATKREEKLDLLVLMLTSALEDRDLIIKRLVNKISENRHAIEELSEAISMLSESQAEMFAIFESATTSRAPALPALRKIEDTEWH